MCSTANRPSGSMDAFSKVIFSTDPMRNRSARARYSTSLRLSIRRFTLTNGGATSAVRLGFGQVAILASMEHQWARLGIKPQADDLAAEDDVLSGLVAGMPPAAE